VAAGLAAAGLIALHSCASFPLSADEVAQTFAAAGVEARDRTAAVGGRTVHWVETGDPTAPTVLFVHGSPGSWDAFIHYLCDKRLTTRARVVSVDRPGYGASDPGRFDPTLEGQAAVLRPILAEARRGAILVGHSWGGPIIVQAAVDEPAVIRGLVLVAASVDPELEQVYWFQRPANWPALAWMVPRDWRVSNSELLPARTQLERLMPHLSEIRVPVTIIQGGRDDLVPPANAGFVAAHLVNSPEVEMVEVAHMNHFVPWTRPELIISAVEQQLDRLAAMPDDDF
jgi:pimeloyl-ACP methyl ester carboxylesterase